MKTFKRIGIILAVFTTLILCAVPVMAGEEGIQWQTYLRGLEMQGKIHKPMLMFFHLPYCYRCKNMERSVLTDTVIIRLINQYFIPVMVDLDKDAPTAQQFRVRYSPTTIIVAPNGVQVVREKDVIAKARFERMLKYVAQERYKVMDFATYESNKE